jgi:hypothetical protein
MSLSKAATLFIGGAFITSGLYADTIISNLGAAALNAPGAGAVDFGSGAEVGTQFTMGPTSFDHAFFTLGILAIGNRSLGPNDVTLWLYGGDTSSPSGSALLTIAPSGPFNGSLNDYVYTAPTDFTLAANTVYWLVASAVQNQEGWVTFDNTLAGAQPTGPFATAPLAYNRSSAGLPTSLFSNTSNVAYAVDGTAVTGTATTAPEPSSFALAIAAIALFAGYKLARRRGFAQNSPLH